MDQIDEILTATDNGWAITALLIVASTFLAWKLGIPILNLVRENTAESKAARVAAEDIQQSIVTNHGSKNLGDAVDRLTEWFLEHMKDSKEERAMVKNLHHSLLTHLLEAALKEDKIAEKLGEIDERVATLEGHRKIPHPRKE